MVEKIVLYATFFNLKYSLTFFLTYNDYLLQFALLSVYKTNKASIIEPTLFLYLRKYNLYQFSI